MTRSRSAETSGFTLVEVAIAAGLLVALSIGVAQLLVVASLRGRAARAQTTATILAAAKLEQLRGFAWGYELTSDGSLVERSDEETDLSVDPPAPGGPGLRPSSPTTLTTNTPFYFDYADASGAWAGNGSRPPANAAFLRRWAVFQLPGSGSSTLVLQVLVRPLAQERAGSTSGWRGRVAEETLLTTVRTRRGQ